MPIISSKFNVGQLVYNTRHPGRYPIKQVNAPYHHGSEEISYVLQGLVQTYLESELSVEPTRGQPPIPRVEPKFPIGSKVITRDTAQTWIVSNTMIVDGKVKYFMKETSEVFSEEALRATHTPKKSKEETLTDRKAAIEKRIQELYDERGQIIKYLKAKQTLNEASKALGL